MQIQVDCNQNGMTSENLQIYHNTAKISEHVEETQIEANRDVLNLKEPTQDFRKNDKTEDLSAYSSIPHVSDISRRRSGELNKDIYEFEEEDESSTEVCLRRKPIEDTDKLFTDKRDEAEKVEDGHERPSADREGDYSRHIEQTPEKCRRLKLTLRMKRSPVLDEVSFIMIYLIDLD